MERIDRMRSESWVAALHDFCRLLLDRRAIVVELGSFAGESTAVFARHASKVFAIDPWDPSYARGIIAGCGNPAIQGFVMSAGVAQMSQIERLFDARVAPFSNVEKIKLPEEQAVQRFESESIDCLYIDTIHTYEAVRGAIQRWFPKIRTGGICGGHDYSRSDWPGVVMAVNEAFGEPPFVFVDTSWAIRKDSGSLRIAQAAAAM